MVDMELLAKTIEDSGMTFTAVALKSGIVRETLYNRFNGIGEFTVSQVEGLTYALKLTREERDNIFFAE
jgi:hypothetical protein